MFSLRIKVLILCILSVAAEEDSKEDDVKYGNKKSSSIVACKQEKY